MSPLRRQNPREEPGALAAHAGICAGGEEKSSSLPRHRLSAAGGSGRWGKAGVNMVHVPYRGAAAAVTDLIGGQVQVMFDNLPNSIEFIRAGRVRALAVTTSTRSKALPDVPDCSSPSVRAPNKHIVAHVAYNTLRMRRFLVLGSADAESAATLPALSLRAGGGSTGSLEKRDFNRAKISMVASIVRLHRTHCSKRTKMQKPRHECRG
jgi:hypothetical protein